MTRLRRYAMATVTHLAHLALPVGRWAAQNSVDLLFLAGLLILSYGCWRAYEPLGFIVFGAFICVPMIVDRFTRKEAKP